MEMTCGFDATVLRAIGEQLPPGFEACATWFPLSLPQGEFYINGGTLMTADDFRQFAMARIDA